MTLLRIGVIFYGLGNQMMSYLYYKARKELTGEKIVLWAPTHRPLADHNGYELDHIFGIKTVSHFWSELLWKIYEHRYHRVLRHFVSAQRDTFTDLSTPRTKGKLIHFILAGDKDKNFYTDRKEEIKRVYTFDSSKLNEESKKWYDLIKQTGNSCSLHIRRGDYIGHPNFDNICTISYYRNALKEMESQVGEDLQYFVFSDDIEWCRQQFSNQNFHYIDCNKGKDSWQDLMLISSSKHHIMANSTFSWWGSFLGEQKDSVVICPPRFTVKDNGENYLPSWIRCNN